MNFHADKKTENPTNSVAGSLTSQEGHVQSLPFTDNRPEAITQRRLKALMQNQPLKIPGIKPAGEPVPQGNSGTVQKKENNTGLPDNLKTGIENLSGIDISDVKVHYNSEKPSQLQAHAYAQGSEIHVAPGQEQHLPHEAWHVVQQKQGRVKPTLQLKNGEYVNDDAGLEREADTMGERSATALQMKQGFSLVQLKMVEGAGAVVQLLRTDVLNVAGENHDESRPRRAEEEAFCIDKTGGRYWQEQEFLAEDKGDKPADSPLLVLNYLLAFIRFFVNRFYEKSSLEGAGALFKELENVASHLIEELEKYFDDGGTDAFSVKYGLYKSKLEDLRSIWNEYPLKEDDKKNLKENDKKKYDLYKLHEGFYKEFLGLGTIEQLPDASTNRGIAMHNAAQLQYEKKGVWKIGRNHVNEIEKYMGEDKKPTYNLMSQKDFNREYEEYIQASAATTPATPAPPQQADISSTESKNEGLASASGNPSPEGQDTKSA